MPIPADAWFIRAAGPGERDRPSPLVREAYELDDLRPDEVLLAPLYGCWEANMRHAIERRPIDVCASRGLERAIIGNAGTARVLALGGQVRGLREGQVVMMFGLETDAWGYPERMMGYDSRISGILTTRLKLRATDVIPLPEGTRHSLQQWAAFNNRYVTAWANWRVAYGAFRLLLSEEEFGSLNVWAWGGGTGFAEVQLATLLGHRGVALTSRPDRAELIRAAGVQALIRPPFEELGFDEVRYRSDPEYAARYLTAEAAFLQSVQELTEGQGVQIFVDLIGAPVFRATLKALSRHGILTTMGWKEGMRLWSLRAVESIARRQFIHTHFARREEAEAAVAFGEEHGWMPVVDDRVYRFDEIPQAAADYAAGRFRMFPIYQVNPE